MMYRLYTTTGIRTRDKLIKQTKGPEQNAPGLFRIYIPEGYIRAACHEHANIDTVRIDCSKREVESGGYRCVVTEYTGIAIRTFADLYVNGFTGLVDAGGVTAGNQLAVLSGEAVPRGSGGELKLSGCHVVAQSIVDYGI